MFKYLQGKQFRLSGFGAPLTLIKWFAQRQLFRGLQLMQKQRTIQFVYTVSSFTFSSPDACSSPASPLLQWPC